MLTQSQLAILQSHGIAPEEIEQFALSLGSNQINPRPVVSSVTATLFISALLPSTTRPASASYLLAEAGKKSKLAKNTDTTKDTKKSAIGKYNQNHASTACKICLDIVIYITKKKTNPVGKAAAGYS